MQVQRRWMLLQSARARARERDASCADVPATQRKTASSLRPRGKAQDKGKAKNAPPDKNTPAKFEGECCRCGKKGHKWAECRKRLAEVKEKKVHAVDGTPSTATVAAVEDMEEIDEAGMCGDWSDDEDDGVDTSEAGF